MGLTSVLGAPLLSQIVQTGIRAKNPVRQNCEGGSCGSSRDSWTHRPPVPKSCFGENTSVARGNHRDPTLEDPDKHVLEGGGSENPEWHLLMGLWGVSQINECPCLTPASAPGLLGRSGG